MREKWCEKDITHATDVHATARNNTHNPRAGNDKHPRERHDRTAKGATHAREREGERHHHITRIQAGRDAGGPQTGGTPGDERGERGGRIVKIFFVLINKSTTRQQKPEA